jgi:hypothetical protein
MPMQGRAQGDLFGKCDMSETVGRFEVVTTAPSCEWAQYQIIRRSDGTYMIVADGRPISALYWRAAELDRCTRLLEQLIAEEPPTAIAA